MGKSKTTKISRSNLKAKECKGCPYADKCSEVVK